MSQVEITYLTDIIDFSKMTEEEKDKFVEKLYWDNLNLLKNILIFFFLEKGAVDDFIQKINVDKVKQKLFGVMSGEKIIDVILEVATDVFLA